MARPYLRFSRPNATAEREAADARMRHNTGRCNQAVRERRIVKMTQERPALAPGGFAAVSTSTAFMSARSSIMPSSQVDLPGQL